MGMRALPGPRKRRTQDEAIVAGHPRTVELERRGDDGGEFEVCRLEYDEQRVRQVLK